MKSFTVWSPLARRERLRAYQTYYVQGLKRIFKDIFSDFSDFFKHYY